MTRFGISTTSADGYVSPDVLARAVEERGFDWLLFDDHSYFPADTPAQEEIPAAFRARLPLVRDLPVVLAYALCATRTLVVGSGVALLPQRDVLHTGKAVATLATLSADRLVLGVGVGWNMGEVRNHGAEPATRGAKLDEQLTALRAIWTHEVTEFHGDHVDFGPIESRPRPVSPVPIYVGGASKAALSRTVRLADGWLPLAPGTTADDVRSVRAWFAQQGRADLGTTVTEVPSEERLAANYLEAGVDRVLFHLDPLNEGDTLAALDALAQIAERLK